VEHLPDHAAIDARGSPALLPGGQARVRAVHYDEVREVIGGEQHRSEVDGGRGRPD
jgi:hypothetical protein